MSNAIKCDRCGKCVTDEFYYFKIQKGNVKHSTLDSLYTKLDCDLCPECVEDFKKFMKNDSKKDTPIDHEFVFVIFDKYNGDIHRYFSEGFRGVFDSLDQAKKAVERPNFKNFKWIDEARYEYDGILARHYGIIMSIPKNELFYAKE